MLVLVLSAVIVPSELAKDFGSGARVAMVPRIAPSVTPGFSTGGALQNSKPVLAMASINPTDLAWRTYR